MPLSRRTYLVRRSLLAAAVLALAALGITCASSGDDAQSADDTRPNFVVVMTDDQDRYSMRVMRSTRRLLAKRGAKFVNAYATFPLCCPSRATYLTAQYAHNNGVESNRPPDGGYLNLDQSTTVPLALKESGYRTAWVGKFLNGYTNQGRQEGDVPRGFSRWFGELTGRMYDWYASDDGEVVKFEGERNYMTDVYQRIGRRFIRRSSETGDAFFLTVATLAPHGEPLRKSKPDNPRAPRRHRGRFSDAPLPRSPAFNERDVSDKPTAVSRLNRLKRKEITKLRLRNRARLESLLSVDELVAGLVRELRRTNELRNTYVVFTTDNGYLLGEHRLYGKTDLYEESAGTPLLISGPRIPRGVTRRQPVGNVDLGATFLKAAGVEPLVDPDGVSLLPFAKRARKGRDRLFLLENRRPSQRSAAVRSQRYKYVEYDLDEDGTTDEYELYDLKRDPYELRNLHAVARPSVRSRVLRRRPALAAKRTRLAAGLDRMRDCAGASCR